MTDKKFPEVPKEAIVRPEDEKPAKMEVKLKRWRARMKLNTSG